MSNGSSEQFQCTACGMLHPWKSSIAGKTGRCKCGNRMVVPAAPIGADPPDDLYAVAPTPTAKKRSHTVEDSVNQPASVVPVVEGNPCPSCGQGLAPDAVICVLCGYNVQTGQKIGTEVKRVKKVLAYEAAPVEKPQDKETEKSTRISEWYIPVGLLVLGVTLQFVRAIWFAPLPPSILLIIPLVLIQLIVNLVLILAACLAAVKLLDLGFGRIGPAILKMCSIAVAPSAIAGIIGYALGGSFGVAMISWSIEIALYLVLFKVLFDVGLDDAWILILLMWLIQTWLTTFLMAIVGTML